MNIDEILKLLQEEFANNPQYTFEPKKVFLKKEDDGKVSDFIAELAILLNGNVIMIISRANNSEEKDKLFYHCMTYGLNVSFFVALHDDEIICKERPYYKSVHKQNIFKIDNTPIFDSIEEEVITKEHLIYLLKHYDDIRFVTPQNIRDFLTACAQKHNIDSVISIINEIDDNCFEYNNHHVWLESTTESRLITSLLNSKKEIPLKLYRYTSKKTLDYLFNAEKKVHSMSSIITMNDPTEIDYANNYLNQVGVCTDSLHFSCYRNNSVNSYITSLTELKDNLTLWRLYGDDARGVCIEYEVPKDFAQEDFLLASVSYADESQKDTNLDFIAELLKGRFHNRSFILRKWHEWQHFFKPHEYAVEKEVRLLTFVDDCLIKHQREWITTPNGIHAPLLNVPFKAQENAAAFPLSIKSILLGSKFQEKDANRITWQYKIKDAFSDCVSGDFQISISKIDNYR